MSLTSEEAQRLQQAATQAAENAYAPYSNFRVGAAILLDDRSIVTGCNVENASFGLTICAERSAMVRAVSEKGPHVRVAAIAIDNLNGAPSSPCGACRQVLSEFAQEDAMVFFPTGSGNAVSGMENRPFFDLFPFSFALAKSPSEPS
ncbi:Cytidine deaminase [Acidisarcina polymorpha]|uniref:Cytidine deaminase n=2 Tax=Acidisarcina polymorpha TaxID=2211140 RepID=A0A2Z5G6B3_9BACT|nr:cytidine deaminase [Acidisarcina polymorpha]AXC14641.1 Cytidine deaminase [Acidisarcina polymorpha]